MKEGSFVAINYIGRVKETGEIFDLTYEDVAKKEKVFRENVKYGPVKVVVGGGFIIRGLEDALKEMKVGEKKTFDIEPSKAFGQRSTELIKKIPLIFFKQQKIDPNPGSYVTINKITGKIASADGGRVNVDFNHPLAGKTLQYDLEIKEELTKTNDKILALVTFLSGFEEDKFEIVVDNNAAEIKTKGVELNKAIKEKTSESILKWIQEIRTVKFSDVYNK